MHLLRLDKIQCCPFNCPSHYQTPKGTFLQKRFCQYRCILHCKSWKGAGKSCVVAYTYIVHGFGVGQHVIECVLCSLKVLQKFLVMDLGPVLQLTDL